MSSECTCGGKFMDAEDYRDHLPCGGTPQEQEIKRLQQEKADLVQTVEAMLRAAMPNGQALSIDEMEAESNAHSTKPFEYIAYALKRERIGAVEVAEPTLAFYKSSATKQAKAVLALGRELMEFKQKLNELSLILPKKEVDGIAQLYTDSTNRIAEVLKS